MIFVPEIAPIAWQHATPTASNLFHQEPSQGRQAVGKTRRNTTTQRRSRSRRGGGARGSRGGSMRLRDSSVGWTMASVDDISTCYKNNFSEILCTIIANLFFFARAQRLETKMKTRGLLLTQGGFLLLFNDTVLTCTMQWTNGKTFLADGWTEMISKCGMIQYLDVLLCAYTKGLSKDKTIDIL